MKRIAVIAFFHTEASLCLAKYIAEQNIYVDYYVIIDLLRDKGCMSGFEYYKASKKLGIHELNKGETPEIYQYSNNLPIKYNLIRILSYSDKLWFFNRFILYYSLVSIRNKKYDAINIIGQHPWVEYIHNILKNENITHSFHEVGSHQNGTTATPLIERVISDKSKVILHSKSTYQRFCSIPNANYCKVANIPFGKFETMLLYQKDCKLNIPLNLKYTTFLFYGYIKPYKGLDLLKEADKILSTYTTNYNIIIAGGGDDPSLQYFREKENSYILNRYISDNELIALNKLCSVVVLPYKSASQSGIVPTTFMLGKPIIATKVGALQEVIKDSYNGLLIEPNNPHDFADAMYKIIREPDFYTELCKGVKKFGNGDDFDWNLIAKKTAEILFS